MDSKINNKEIVGIVIDELEKMSIIKKNYSTYKNTERILYDYPKLKDTIVERKEQIKELKDYDIDTPLKKELSDARLKIISLEDALHCYKQEKENLIKWLKNAIRLCNKTIDDLSKPFYADEIKIEIPSEVIKASYSSVAYLEILDKVRGVDNE